MSHTTFIHIKTTLTLEVQIPDVSFFLRKNQLITSWSCDKAEIGRSNSKMTANLSGATLDHAPLTTRWHLMSDRHFIVLFNSTLL